MSYEVNFHTYRYIFKDFALEDTHRHYTRDMASLLAHLEEQQNQKAWHE